MRKILCLALLGALFASCQQPEGQQSSGTKAGAAAPSTPEATAGAGPQTLADGLVIEDLVLGQGIAAVPGKRVSVHYTGMFTDGRKFDSSLDRGQPYTFRLGSGEVIKGWDEGVAGMKIHGKRKLTVPPSLGYGPNGYGPIPGNSTLMFEVELLDIQP